MPKAFHADPDHPAVPYLVRLHADIGGRIKENRLEAARLAQAIKHVEAVIQLYDPAFNLRRISAKRRNRVNPWFRRGTMFPAVLHVLRVAEESLTVREIARRVLANRGEAEPSMKAVREVEGGIRSTLKYKEGKSGPECRTGSSGAVGGKIVKLESHFLESGASAPNMRGSVIPADKERAGRCFSTAGST